MAMIPVSVGADARAFVQGFETRFALNRGYQLVVHELREFLCDASRWLEHVESTAALPRESGRLRADVFAELTEPLLRMTGRYFDLFNAEAISLAPDEVPAHRTFAQATLHPWVLGAPFVHRTFTKPLGYAGDFQMVNQIVSDPRQGLRTYDQMVNTAFLTTPVATAHRNRIDILVTYLRGLADQARRIGRPFRVLNVACGPAFEVQRFLKTEPEPDWLQFDLLDFSDEALRFTRTELARINATLPRPGQVQCQRESVQHLVKHRLPPHVANSCEYDAVYCAGLFDYLSDRFCRRLLHHFAARIRPCGSLLVTNVHPANPHQASMEHLLEWFLLYRDETALQALMPETVDTPKVWADPTGINVFVEARVRETGPLAMTAH